MKPEAPPPISWQETADRLKDLKKQRVKKGKSVMQRLETIEKALKEQGHAQL